MLEAETTESEGRQIGTRPSEWVGRVATAPRVFVVALLVRLAVGVCLRLAQPTGIVPDERWYSGLVQAAVSGNIEHRSETTRLWLFIRANEFSSRAFGSTALAPVAAQALAGALVALITLLLARKLSSRREVPPVVALIVAMWPSQVVWSSILLREVFVWLTSVACAYLLFRIRRTASPAQQSVGLAAIIALILLAIQLRSLTGVVLVYAVVLFLIVAAGLSRVTRIVAIALVLIAPMRYDMGVGAVSWVRSNSEGLAEWREQLAFDAKSGFIDTRAGSPTTPPTNPQFYTDVELMAGVAQAIGISLDDVASELASGRSFAQIAQANGTSVDEVIDTLVVDFQYPQRAAVAKRWADPSTQYDEQALTQIAQLMGMSRDDLVSQMRDDRSIAQIAQANGTSTDSMLDELAAESRDGLRRRLSNQLNKIEIAPSAIATDSTLPMTPDPSEPALAIELSAPTAPLDESGQPDLSFEVFAKGLPAFLVRPFPGETTTSMQATFASLENPFWMILYVLAAWGAWRAFRARRTALLFPFVFTAGISVAAAFSQANLGTAFRHRGQILFSLALLSIPAFERIIEMWRERRTRGPQPNVDSVTTVVSSPN